MLFSFTQDKSLCTEYFRYSFAVVGKLFVFDVLI